MSNSAKTLLLLAGWLLVAASVAGIQGVSHWPAAEAEIADANDSDRECRSSCPGDDENGECPPECDACPCCPSAVTPAVVSGELPAPPAQPHSELPLAIESGRVEEGALSRVFHPPRAAAA